MAVHWNDNEQWQYMPNNFVLVHLKAWPIVNVGHLGVNNYNRISFCLARFARQWFTAAVGLGLAQKLAHLATPVERLHVMSLISGPQASESVRFLESYIRRLHKKAP